MYPPAQAGLSREKHIARLTVNDHRNRCAVYLNPPILGARGTPWLRSSQFSSTTSMRSVVLCLRPDISYKNAAHKHDLSRLAKAKAKASNEFHSDFPEPASGQTARCASFPSHAATRAAFIKCARRRFPPQHCDQRTSIF